MKIKAETIVNEIKDGIKKNQPQILTGIGIGGFITTVVLAVKATPKALDLMTQELDIINDEIIERNLEVPADADDDQFEALLSRLPIKDTIRATWRCYAPAVILGTLSTVCILSAASVNTRRNAALATAYKLSETAFTEYREKVVETEGEEKDQAIRDAIAKDHIDKNPVDNGTVIIASDGDSLFYDSLSGRYFKSSVSKINKATNKLNKYMMDNMYVSLNEFYNAIGIENLPFGDDLGWVADKGLIELYYSTQLTADDQSCIVINYDIEPQANYDRATY